MAEVKTIFIVDDDTTQLTMMKDYFDKHPTFSFHIFKSGEECLNNLDLNPEIIFLDYNFDQAGARAMNGIEILKKIKAKKPDTEVVMLSGQDKLEVAVNTMKYGAFDYIVKNESAFQRSDNVIYNILRRMKFQAEAHLYKRLTLIFGIAFVIMIILIAVFYKMGMIANSPGWV